jgi:peptidylprolyl isomerase
MTDSVNDDSTVKVNYIGRLEDKQIFDTSIIEVAKKNEIFNEQRDYAPLEVKMGQQQVIPGFENALKGMNVGEKKTVSIPPEEAYGQINPQNVVSVPDEQFVQNNIPMNKGTVIQTSQGIATITDYNQTESTVTLDFNHPLAGKTLEFELEVVEII